MEGRLKEAEEQLFVNYSCFFPPKGYINYKNTNTYHSIRKEENWFIQNESDGDDDLPLCVLRFTCKNAKTYHRQSRRVKNFLEIDYIELVIKPHE